MAKTGVTTQKVIPPYPLLEMLPEGAEQVKGSPVVPRSRESNCFRFKAFH